MMTSEKAIYVVTGQTTSKALWQMLNQRLNHDRIRHALKVSDHQAGAAHDYHVQGNTTDGNCETCVALMNEARALIQIEVRVVRALRGRGEI